MKSEYRKMTNCRRKGSTLILVLVITGVISIVTGSIVGYSLFEARTNQRDLLTNESRLAMESVLGHGMAQLRERFDRTRQLGITELYPDRATALKLEAGFLDLMEQGRADIPETFNAPTSYQTFIDEPTILGGLLVNGGNPRVLSLDPEVNLPEEGRPGVPTDAEVREVQIYAKATVTDPRWGSIASYGKQTFQILDRSLFQNSTFFNGLLEIFPGANFNLGMGGGPIYASDIRIGNNTRVHTRVETPGDFRIGRYHNTNDTGDTAFLTDFNLFDGTIPDDPRDATYLKDLRTANTGGSSALQTGVDGFRELASREFNGGLLTAEHGITPRSAVGLEFLRELTLREDEVSGRSYEDGSGNFDQGLFDRTGSNFGHLLIEPSRPLVNIDDPALPDADREILEALNSVEESKWANRSALAIELDPANESIRMFHQPVSGGNPVFDPSTGERMRTEIDITDAFPDEDSRFWTVELFSQPGGGDTEVVSGLYDFRQAGGGDDQESGQINLVRLDVEMMRRWVEESWTADDLPTGETPVFDNDWWNGGIYVELPEQSASVRPDGVVPAASDWAVQVYNATTLPNRSVVDPAAEKGLTLSTNGAMYVQGTYNAPDGLDWDPDTFGVAEGAEVPAALVGDAIMLLSDAWDNRNSGLRDRDARTASDTVFSTALVMGNVPSEPGRYSGGLENFPRFLEFWNNGGRRAVTYRGSLIRLFRSESFNARWGSGNVYNPPNRDWSFHTGYRDLPPPLDVGPRSFRRVYFKELTKAEFEDETRNIFGPIAGGS